MSKASLQYCALLIVLVALPVRSLPNRITGDTSITVAPGQEPPLDRIVMIAKENNIPLGIVANDGRLCEGALVLDGITRVDVNSLIQIVNNQISGYRLILENGVLIVEPEHSPENIDQLLRTNIPYFRPEPSTMSALSLYLWIYIRAAIRPREGSILDILSNPDSVVIQGFRVDKPASVREILNLIVQQSTGGVWVLAGLPKDWKDNLNNNPVTITSYADDKQILLKAGCSAVMPHISQIAAP